MQRDKLLQLYYLTLFKNKQADVPSDHSVSDKSFCI